MRSLLAGIRSASRVSLLVVAVAVTLVALGHDARPATGATGTRIVISKSNTSPIPLSAAIIMYPNGPSVDLYVWAVDVKDPEGVGTFNVHFSYDNAFVFITAFDNDTTWLASTGRTATCAPPQGSTWPTFPPHIRPVTGDPDDLWEATGGFCWTPDPAGPNGPQGTGLIASLTVAPNPVVVPPESTTLDFTFMPPLVTEIQTYIIDVGIPSQGVGPAVIPATVPTTRISLVRCADFDMSGGVDLFGDIVSVIQHFGTSVGGAGWDPIYDLDGSGNIDLFTDIVGTIVQFGMQCTQPA